MTGSRSYPEGVTSWIDNECLDVEAAKAFYRELFGWTFSDGPGPGGVYAIAKLDGADVAGIVEATDDQLGSAVWNTYVAVADLDAAATRIKAAGGRLLSGPTDVGQDGRFAVCADPFDVRFRLWQAGLRMGAQTVNTPGAWNFSDLHAADPSASATFYSEVFGWSFDDLGFATMIRLPGYGDHLQATVDPTIHERQSGVAAPPGFADCIGWLVPVAGADEPPHWHVALTVADRDETVAAAERFGGVVLDRTDTDWTRDALIRDPQGGVFTASQFAPPAEQDELQAP